MRMVYTLQDGRLEFDSDWGRADGPRAIDSKAGLVRFADPAADRRLEEFAAVAVLCSERMVRVPSVEPLYVVRPTMVHSVVLVPTGLPVATAELVEPPPLGRPSSGFSIYQAAQTLAEASLLVGLGSAGTCRQTAKAAARLASLPMVELYGEFPVWRPRRGLDLSLRTGPHGPHPPAAPGPPPPGLEVHRSGPVLAIREAAGAGPRRSRLLLALGGVAAAGAAALLCVAVPAALALAVASAAAILGALPRRRPAGRSLEVSAETVRWRSGETPDETATEAVEMLRVVDGTLVIVTWEDEIRCDFTDPASAAWVRDAVLHHLLSP